MTKQEENDNPLKTSLLKHGERLAILEERSKTLHAEIQRRVTLERYTPVEKLVFGIIGLVLSIFIGIIIERVFING